MIICKYLFIKTVPYYFWMFFIFFNTQGRHIIYKIFQNNLLTYSESAHVCFSSFSWCINLFTDFEDLSSHTNITDWETNFYFCFFAISADSRWTLQNRILFLSYVISVLLVICTYCKSGQMKHIFLSSSITWIYTTHV